MGELPYRLTQGRIAMQKLRSLSMQNLIYIELFCSQLQSVCFRVLADNTKERRKIGIGLNGLFEKILSYTRLHSVRERESERKYVLM